MLVSCIYKKTEEAELFHIHDCVLKSLVFKRKRKNMSSHCESISFEDSPAHIHLCTQCVVRAVTV